MALRLRAVRAMLTVAVVFVPTILTATAGAQTYTVLYSFTGGADGGIPVGRLALDSTGNLYGTTVGGGARQVGTVFKLDPTGAVTVLHSFAPGTDGYPPGDLAIDATGNLYGYTAYGSDRGSGTIFKLDSTGQETILHRFGHSPDGYSPVGLILGASGNIYGATSGGGGPFGGGTVFALDSAGNETLLHGFTGDPDGEFPGGSVTRDAAGNLYGTTTQGGTSRAGTVFRVDPSRNEQVLYSFTGGADGSNPSGSLVRDAAGNLYGTTAFGGSSGRGTVFKLDLAGTLTVLHSFIGATDGSQPASGLIRDPAGNLYGTAERGGVHNLGTVFQLNSRTGQFSVLHSFAGGTDGADPAGGLIRDAAGNLYGCAALAGAHLRGVVFKLTPQ